MSARTIAACASASAIPASRKWCSRHVLGDFAKADREWLEPLLDAIADNAAMMAKGDEIGFMNKAQPRRPAREAPAREAGKTGADAARPPKQQSHIRQARPQAAGRQAAGKRPDGRHAEEAVRRQGLSRIGATGLDVDHPYRP